MSAAVPGRAQSTHRLVELLESELQRSRRHLSLPALGKDVYSCRSANLQCTAELQSRFSILQLRDKTPSDSGKVREPLLAQAHGLSCRPDQSAEVGRGSTRLWVRVVWCPRPMKNTFGHGLLSFRGPRSMDLVLGLALALALGCGPKEYVRGSQEPGIDAPAMSTGLDKQDIQQMLKENLNNLRLSPAMDTWRKGGGKTVVAVFPFSNETSEHIESQLQAILSEAETWLVDSNTVTVVSRERQNQMIAEIEGTRHAVFNPAHVAQYGKQLGAQYFLTGKVQTSDERTEDARRVQYFFFMQVIEVETGAIRWQHKAYVTKLVR